MNSIYKYYIYFYYNIEGVLLSKYSKGVIRGLQMINMEWVPLKKSENLWLIGMFNFDLLGVNLEKDEMHPKVHPRP